MKRSFTLYKKNNTFLNVPIWLGRASMVCQFSLQARHRQLKLYFCSPFCLSYKLNKLSQFYYKTTQNRTKSRKRLARRGIWKFQFTMQRIIELWSHLKVDRFKWKCKFQLIKKSFSYKIKPKLPIIHYILWVRLKIRTI